MRVTAFTCLVGSTADRIRPPGFISPSVRYVCLSDRPMSPFPYRHVPVAVPLGQSPQLFARQLKILADHPALGGTDVLLWHDAAFRLNIDPALVARQELGGHDLMALRHPDRTQIEEEAAAIALCGYADVATVTTQAAHYRAEWTSQTAITTTGYLFRRRTEKVQEFNTFWWGEVERWCYRDQMSVDYAAWKTGVVCHYLTGDYRHNPYAHWFNSASTARPIMARPSARPSWPYRRPGVVPR